MIVSSLEGPGRDCLIDAVGWPVFILIVVLLLRKQLVALVGRVREIEGPGDVKITLDAGKVEQIIAKGQRENAPPRPWRSRSCARQQCWRSEKRESYGRCSTTRVEGCSTTRPTTIGLR